MTDQIDSFICCKHVPDLHKWATTPNLIALRNELVLHFSMPKNRQTDFDSALLIETEKLRFQLAQVRHEAFCALERIVEMESETHDIEEAITIAKERIRYFAPSPTDHTNQ